MKLAAAGLAAGLLLQTGVAEAGVQMVQPQVKKVNAAATPPPPPPPPGHTHTPRPPPPRNVHTPDTLQAHATRSCRRESILKKRSQSLSGVDQYSGSVATSKALSLGVPFAVVLQVFQGSDSTSSSAPKAPKTKATPSPSSMSEGPGVAQISIPRELVSL